MHALGIVLIWTAIQVTVICLIVLFVLRLSRKTEPLWRGRVVLAGIVASLVISAFALSPWPSWQGYWSTEQPRSHALEDSSGDETAEIANPLDSSEGKAGSPNSLSAKATDDELVSPWSAAWAAFLDEMKTPSLVPGTSAAQSDQAQYALTLAYWIALIVLCGVGCGFARLIAGIWLLRKEVAISPVLDDERVRSAIQSIEKSFGKSHSIEVRVTARLQSAATTGIRRPILLLPVSWEEWTDEELHAVLAHELNHIHRHDCLMALCAELARVLHFYHPLVHWLANRLRLEQEWAADAQAAQSLGGRKRYLCILAEMALNESSNSPAWPVRAFLPSHRTFMRRIEMLKNNQFPDRRVSRVSRWTALASIGLATVFALGLRGQGSLATAQEENATKAGARGQTETTSNAQNGNAAFPLTYVPDEAIGVFGLRPKVLLAQPALKPVTELILKTEGMSKAVGVPVDQIEQVVWSMGARDNFPPEPMMIAAMVKISGKWDLEKLKQELTPESTTGFYGGQLYLKKANGQGPAFWLADERTLIYSDSEEGLKEAIDARNLSAARENRIPAWNSVAKQTVAGFINVAQFRKLMEREQDVGGGPMTAQQAFQAKMRFNPIFGPIWREVDTVVGGVDFGREINLKVTAHAKDEKGATKVEETLNALLVLGRNMVEQNQQMISQLPERERKMIGTMLSVSQEMIKSLKVERDSTNVVAEARLPENSVSLITALLMPAVTGAREAAQRAQSTNNLKQIGLAMHNYHDTHKHFPTPVVMGRDGKTPHSWRVAILPFIGEGGLYDQYKFDEPWDSEHNKTLIAKIPQIYRHPMDKQDSTNASYFALVGAKTLMGDNKQGTRFHDITDGTSSTLMIVEAKKDIPWTKPEDIAYPDDRAKAPPELGGWFKDGFLAVLGDGAARFFKGPINKVTMQNLIERNDGQPINFDNILDQPRRGRQADPRPTDRARPATRGDREPGRDEGEESAEKEASASPEGAAALGETRTRE